MLDIAKKPDTASLADRAQHLLRMPLLSLIHEAAAVHRAHHDVEYIQKSSLLSIKTGGCPEDCAYCPQSAHHKEVGLQKEHFIEPQLVVELAKRAKSNGAERFCMGAAWRRVRDGKQFDAVLEMVRGVRDLDMEACVTLGMLETAPGASFSGCRPDGLQPQSGYRTRVLRRNHWHAHLSRSIADIGPCAQRGHYNLLRWHHRDG